MRTDHPDPAEREQLDAEDLAFAELLEAYLAGRTTAAARERFWIRAVEQLGPIAACRLNAVIALHEALAPHVKPTTRRS